VSHAPDDSKNRSGDNVSLLSEGCQDVRNRFQSKDYIIENAVADMTEGATSVNPLQFVAASMVGGVLGNIGTQAGQRVYRELKGD
jgi:hypothetical protein